MSKVTCHIESKCFFFKYDGKDVIIREYGRMYSSAAFVSITIARWITTEMEKISGIFEEGFVTKRRDNDKVVILSIRRNESGIYSSIFIISKDGKKSNMALCVPHSSNGWDSFTKALRKIIPNEVSHPRIQKEISMETVGGIQSLLIRKRHTDLVETLTTSAVIASFNNYSYSWKLLVGDLVCILDLSNEPKISPIGGNSFLITCNTLEDANQILSLQKMVIDGCVISFRRWKPCSGTLQASRYPCRWIELIGLPVHLINKSVIDEICSSFGKIKTIDSLMGVPNRFNCIQIELSEVDVLKIPHYVSVIDQGVAYLVRISIAIHELYPFRKNRPKLGRKVASALVPDTSPDPVPDPVSIPASSPVPAVPPTYNLSNLAPSIPKTLAVIPPVSSQPPSSPNRFPLNSHHSSLSVNPINVIADNHVTSPKNSLTSPRFNSGFPSPSNPPIPLSHPTPRHSPPHLSKSISPPAQPFLIATPPPCSDLVLVEDPPPSTFISPSQPPQPPSLLVPALTFGTVSFPKILSSEGQQLVVDDKSGDELHRQNIEFEDSHPSLQGDKDDGLVSDSGDESSHSAENLEEQEESVLGEDVVNFITKKLVELNKILDLTAENKRMSDPLSTEKEKSIGSTSRVEQDDGRKLSMKKMNDKKVREMATRSARRRKRGALLLQAEETHLEST